MAHKKSRPGKGKSGAWESFSYWGPPVSIKPRYAHVAGEPEWYECHEHNAKQDGTKICLHWFTDGALKCPRCRPLQETSTLAYLPLYREEDGKPVFVIVHENAADTIDGLTFGEFVYVGRVDGVSSVYAKRADEKKPLVSALPSRQRPCYLMPSLLMVWDYPELDGWLRVNGMLRLPSAIDESKAQPSSDNPLSQESKPSMPADPLSLSTLLARGVIGLAGGEQPPSLGKEAVAECNRRFVEAAKNGKHKPKP